MTTGSDDAVCPTCAPRLVGVLHRLRTPQGTSAAAWLWGPARGEAGHLVLGGDSVVVHPDTAGPGVTARAQPGALPVPSRSVAAVVVPPVLPGLPDLDGLFAEIRRVLRPHGMLAMMVPDGPSLGLRGRRLRTRVRDHWSHRSAVDHPEWLLTAADFAVMGDDRLGFRLPDVDAEGGPRAVVDTLCTAGLLPPGLPDDLRADLATRPALRAGRLPLRRLVARR